jgi:hypothetical protein
MVAGERRRPAASNTETTVTGPPPDGQQIPALPYRADAGRATARLGETERLPERERDVEMIEARPQRERAGREPRRPHLACKAGAALS